MTPFPVFPIQSLPWKSPDTLPRDRLVLARLSHYRDLMPERLVFARATEDGIELGQGGELSETWTLRGWLDTDVEIELLSSSAAAATPAPLSWEVSSEGVEIAADGLGGHYVICMKNGRRKLYHEVDLDRLIMPDPGCDLRIAAQAHHDARVRRALSD